MGLSANRENIPKITNIDWDTGIITFICEENGKE